MRAVSASAALCGGTDPSLSYHLVFQASGEQKSKSIYFLAVEDITTQEINSISCATSHCLTRYIEHAHHFMHSSISCISQQSELNELLSHGPAL